MHRMNFLFKSLFISVLLFALFSFLALPLTLGVTTIKEPQNICVEVSPFGKDNSITGFIPLSVSLIKKLESPTWLGLILLAVFSYAAIQQFYLDRPPAEAYSQDVLIAGLTGTSTLIVVIGVIIGTICIGQNITSSFLFFFSCTFLLVNLISAHRSSWPSRPG